MLVQENHSVDMKSSHELCVLVKMTERRALNLDSVAATVRHVCCSLPRGLTSRGSSSQQCSLLSGFLFRA